MIKQEVFFDYTDENWKEKIERMIEALIKKHRLPNSSLSLNESTRRERKDRVISYTISIFEPDYPMVKEQKRRQGMTVMSFTYDNEKVRSYEFEFKIRSFQEMSLKKYLPSNSEVLSPEDKNVKNGIATVRVKCFSEDVVEYIKRNIEFCIENYTPRAATFGCCSRYKECSTKRECVHENKLYSKACMYRKNLETGKVFYHPTKGGF